ncbi:lipid-A-disaccharide synthase [Teredinibacter purpureus]|uniref:lipid-A-disaccharide synthase n=1 Tax=Teredinibacter purpureus TaxID=2731756 RepID=UPI0005F7E706|nr:lipid-A-disaccharide synthase [Teredinibacter purpureus]
MSKAVGGNSLLTRVGIVVGETSGDILGAGLMAELQRRYPNCIFEGVGGPRMTALGFKSLHDMERLAVMGLIDPLKRLPELLSIRKQLCQHFIQNPPDIFVGVDAPDFNLTLEEKLRKAGVLTAHYVSPSVWAWRQGRVKKIARAVDLMLTLFPFEEQFYRDHNVRVVCVGHTLADEIPLDVDRIAAQKTLCLPVSNAVKTIAILPGSRAGEVSQLCETFFHSALQLMAINSAQLNADVFTLRFVVAAANEKRKSQIESIATKFPQLPLTVFLKQSHEVMASADIVLMASGTTTLEAMLLKKPMVIAYKMGAFSWWVLSRLVKSAYVGLPNLLAKRLLVPELLQREATAENIANALNEYLVNVNSVKTLLVEFDKIHLSLRKNADKASADAVCTLVATKRDKNTNA